VAGFGATGCGSPAKAAALTPTNPIDHTHLENAVFITAPHLEVSPLDAATAASWEPLQSSILARACVAHDE
jgi:hypothetical protein